MSANQDHLMLIMLYIILTYYTYNFETDIPGHGLSRETQLQVALDSGGHNAVFLHPLNDTA